MKKTATAEKFCGNCENHTVYEYPAKILCIYRFLNRLDPPVVSTLWYCDCWKHDTQECLCVEKASEKQITRKH